MRCAQVASLGKKMFQTTAAIGATTRAAVINDTTPRAPIGGTVLSITALERKAAAIVVMVSVNQVLRLWLHFQPTWSAIRCAAAWVLPNSANGNASVLNRPKTRAGDSPASRL